jgi:hypothetical protein
VRCGGPGPGGASRLLYPLPGCPTSPRGLAVVLIALVSGRFQLGRADRRLILLSGACVAAYQATFFAAVDDTGVAVGTVVAIGSAPVFTGLLARTFAGEQLTGRWAGATALGCAGVCTLVLGSGSGGEVSLPGVGLALFAGAGYAGYAVAGKSLMDQGATPEALMATMFTIGAVFLVPVLAFIPTGELLSGPGLALAVYLGALPHGTRLRPLRTRPRAHRRRRDGHTHPGRAGHRSGSRFRAARGAPGSCCPRRRGARAGRPRAAGTGHQPLPTCARQTRRGGGVNHRWQRKSLVV